MTGTARTARTVRAEQFGADGIEILWQRQTDGKLGRK
jgi:hypothetical protein